MLRSCSLCGKIHDSKYMCKQKELSIKERQKKFKYTTNDKFRSTQAWQHKREEIKDRDLQLCQICIRNLYMNDNLKQYTYDNLSVHHAVPLEEDYSRRLDNDILITTCDHHHEMMESGEIPRDIVLDIIEEQENAS